MIRVYRFPVILDSGFTSERILAKAENNGNSGYESAPKNVVTMQDFLTIAHLLYITTLSAFVLAKLK